MSNSRVARLPIATTVAVAGLVGLGLVAGRYGFGPFEFQAAVLTLITGWVVAGCGLVAWRRVPASRIGPLLIAAGCATYIGAFRFTALHPLADLATWLYVAVIGHAVLTQPSGRVRRRLVAGLVVGLYLVALLPTADPPLVLALGLGSALALRRLVLGNDARRGSADVAGVLLCLGLTSDPLLSAMTSTGAINVHALLQVALIVAALILASDLLRTTATQARVTDLVLRLDRAAPSSLAEEMRRATGDPTLEVGYWLPERDRYVDASGRGVALPDEGSPRVLTPVLRDERRVAVLIHDPGLEAASLLSKAVPRAAELVAANARLQAELRSQVREVRDSRRRIVDAVQEERSVVGHRLGGGLLLHLDRLSAMVIGLDDGTDDAVRRARVELADVRGELARLADGLYPKTLEERGLRGALEELVRRSPVSVRLLVADTHGVPLTTGATLYFVCSEALTNIAKHAAAANASVSLRREPRELRLEVVDDGVGGADPAAGTGLRGMRDRVEALGGSLRLTSPAGSGTHLWVTLPYGATS